MDLDCDSNTYNIIWKGTDIGTRYGYKVQAFHNSNSQLVIGESDPEYINIQTGIKGYFYNIDDSESTEIVGN